MDRLRSSGGLAIVLVAWMLATSGCGPSRQQTITEQRLKQLATMYLDYAVTQNGAAPASEAVLKNHIRRLDAVQLQATGLQLAELDQLFTSERDGQPFVLRYGVGMRDISGQKAPLLAYEQQGQGGKRLVAYGNTRVEELSETELNEALQKAAE